MNTLGGDELRGGGGGRFGADKVLKWDRPFTVSLGIFFFKKVGEGAKASHRPDSIGTVI